MSLLVGTKDLCASALGVPVALADEEDNLVRAPMRADTGTQKSPIVLYVYEMVNTVACMLSLR